MDLDREQFKRGGWSREEENETMRESCRVSSKKSRKPKEPEEEKQKKAMMWTSR